MQKFSLDALAREHLKRAISHSTRRSATTVYGGHEHHLHQTLLALAGGTQLSEHVSPGEATLLVLHGRIRLHADTTSWDGRTGDLIVIPHTRHHLEALDDTAVLLTVAKQ